MEKTIVPMKDINKYIKSTLEEIQKNLFDKAYKFREEHITEVDTFDKFKSVLSVKGGFVSAHWDGTLETEQAIKKQTKATFSCIPFSEVPKQGNCIYSGKPSSQRVLFAKSY
jgi:prolyl-tRNA synthetase